MINASSFIKPLIWDSDFFDINICEVYLKNKEKWLPKDKFHKYIREKDINFLQAKLDSKYAEGIAYAQHLGMKIVDCRIVLGSKDRLYTNFEEIKILQYDPIKSEEIIAGFSINYENSRYYIDTNFDNKKVEEFYKNWLQKAVKGTFDDECYFFEKNNKIIGFCTIKYDGVNKKNCGIGLFYIFEEFRGLNLGYKSLSSLLYFLPVGYISVVTQGRNINALRMYENLGFRVESTSFYFHMWI